MLDKFAKIEAFLNMVMTKLGHLLWKLGASLVPPSLQKFWLDVKNKCVKRFIHAQLKIKSSKERLIGNIKKSRNALAWLKTKSEDSKLWVKSAIQALKDFLLATPIQSTMQFFTHQTNNLSLQVRSRITKKQLSFFPRAGLALIMLSLGAYGVYTSSKTIMNKEYPYREPASVQVYDEKPEYYYYAEKTLTIRNIKVPLQVSRAGRMNSLTIDFSIRTSTRFARYYLFKNEHKLKDYFFTSVEPILSDFVLEAEGKEVLKEKIQSELQNFLKAERVEGKIEEVNLLYIVGS